MAKNKLMRREEIEREVGHGCLINTQTETNRRGKSSHRHLIPNEARHVCIYMQIRRLRNKYSIGGRQAERENVKFLLDGRRSRARC